VLFAHRRANRLPHRVWIRCERVGRLDEEDAFIAVGGRHEPLLLLTTLPGDQMGAADEQRHRPVDDAERRRPAYGRDERQAGPVAAGTPRSCLGRTDTCHAVDGSALTRMVPALSARMTCLPFADHSLRGACPGPVGPRGRSLTSKVLRARSGARVGVAKPPLPRSDEAGLAVFNRELVRDEAGCISGRETR